MPAQKQTFPELTKTDLMRLTGFSREQATKVCELLKPVRANRGRNYYDAAHLLKAAVGAQETPKERGERLKADILEEKLSRMRGESIDLEACQLVWGEKLKRLADTIRGIDGLDTKEKRRLCAQLRADLDRLPAELESCRFDEARGDEEDEE